MQTFKAQIGDTEKNQYILNLKGFFFAIYKNKKDAWIAASIASNNVATDKYIIDNVEFGISKRNCIYRLVERMRTTKPDFFHTT